MPVLLAFKCIDGLHTDAGGQDLNIGCHVLNSYNFKSMFTVHVLGEHYHVLEENIIMQEARNLLALRDMTPFSEKQLSAAGLPELYEGTGFGGQSSSYRRSLI